MKTNIYSIFDKKTMTYSSPFCALNNEEAKRVIEETLKQGGLLANYPADYSCSRIGNFEQETGKIKPITPHIICEVLEITQTIEREEKNAFEKQLQKAIQRLVKEGKIIGLEDTKFDEKRKAMFISMSDNLKKNIREIEKNKRT